MYTKHLSKNVTAIFKLFNKNIGKYYSKTIIFCGVERFWVIQNSKPFIDSINKLNSCKKANQVSIFSSSTLYTKIPHIKFNKFNK